MLDIRDESINKTGILRREVEVRRSGLTSWTLRKSFLPASQLHSSRSQTYRIHLCYNRTTWRRQTTTRQYIPNVLSYYYRLLVYYRTWSDELGSISPSRLWRYVSLQEHVETATFIDVDIPRVVVVYIFEYIRYLLLLVVLKFVKTPGFVLYFLNESFVYFYQKLLHIIIIVSRALLIVIRLIDICSVHHQK